MWRWAGILVLAGCAVPCGPGVEALKPQLEEVLASAGGEWGVYFKDLQDGETLSVRGDAEFHPASTLKIFVMIKIFLDVHAGLYALDDEIEVTDTFPSEAKKDPKPFKVAASVKAVTDAVGRRMSVRDLVEHMITVSDNLATNNLIRKAGGPREIKGMLTRLGVTRSTVARYLMDDQAYDEGFSSVAVPCEYGHVLEQMWRRRILSERASSAMLQVMSRLKGNHMLPWHLPKEARVAHKTGAFDGVRNDIGVVTLPDGRGYVAVFFSRGLKNDRKGESGIAEASRLLYRYIAAKR